MAHRDDREALRAKVDALQRELADAHDELDRERRRPPRQSVGARVAGIVAWVIERAARAWDYVFATSPSWTPLRAWSFAAIAAIVVGGTLVAVIGWGAATEGETELTTFGIALIAWCFVGAPLAMGIVARALRAPGSPLGAGGATLAIVVLAVFVVAGIPALRDAPRLLLDGRAAGTVESVSAQPRAAWASITPAYVWTAYVGTGVTSYVEDGQTRSSSQSASPIVPTIPWSGEVSLFLCDDADALRAEGPGRGTIAGRVERVTGNAASAVERLREAGVRVGPQPRCVTPTLGGADTTFGIGALALMLYLALFTLGGAWMLMRLAGDKTTRE